MGEESRCNFWQRWIAKNDLCKGNLEKLVVSGHSLGSAVGAGLLKVIDVADKYEKFGILYAQPNSFENSQLAFLTHEHLNNEQAMEQSVINVHNIHDPVVMASEISGYDPLGTELSFGSGKWKMEGPAV